MKLLLDTQTWVWSALEPGRINPRTAETLVDSQNELWLSPISVWEVLLLARKKRIVLEPDAQTAVRQWLRDRPLREAVMTREIAMVSEAIELSNQDPADRFLAATAKVLGLTLVTSDRHLLACRDISTLSAS